MDVLGYSDNTAGHLSLELVLAGDVGWVRPTETHGDAEALDASNGYIGIHLTCWLGNGS